MRIRLSDGTEYVIRAKLPEWEAAFQRATASNKMLEIALPDGSIRPIDPRSIEWFREEGMLSPTAARLPVEK